MDTSGCMVNRGDWQSGGGSEDSERDDRFILKRWMLFVMASCMRDSSRGSF